MDTNELDLDELIIALEIISGPDSETIDTTSVTYRAASYLRAFQNAWEDAVELAQFVSYAEIVGGISTNRGAIRDSSDKVFSHNHKLDNFQLNELRG